MRRSFVLLFIVFCFTIFASPIQADSARGLQGYWAFNGNANDSTGNYNDLTVSGATLTSDRYSNTNSAYSLDGLNDYLYITNTNQTGLDITGDKTIALWYKGTDNNEYLVMMNDGCSNNGYALHLGFRSNGKITFTDGGAFPANGANTTINDGNWHHVAAVRNGNTIYYYHNGVSDGSETLTNTSNSYSGTRSIGAQNGAMSGDFDDVRVYNRALTATEIFTLAHPADCDEDGDVDFDDLSCKRQEINNWVEYDFIPDMN